MSTCARRFWGTTLSSSVWRRSCRTRLTLTSTSTPPFSKPTSEVRDEGVECPPLSRGPLCVCVCRSEPSLCACVSAVVGGLLSAHLLAGRAGMELEPGWPCAGPLLRMAEDAARKLLPGMNRSVNGDVIREQSVSGVAPHPPNTTNKQTKNKNTKIPQFNYSKDFSSSIALTSNSSTWWSDVSLHNLHRGGAMKFILLTF